MATEKSFQLYINEDNVKQYFTTSGGALNGAAIGGKYITMRTSSTTARFTMNDAGRDVLFPSAAATAHKVDVWAQTIATLNNSKNTINVAIAGQNAITTERIHTSLIEHTGSVSGSFTKSNASAVYVVKIANSFHAAGVRDTSITAYFTQYSCTASKAGNGVKNVSVSNTAPYEGETVTFSAELYNGANFDGWYSDESCTQLVSSSLTYSTTAAADLTLYAKATIDANLYNVSAVAGAEITSVNVSDSIVPEGSTATFTAQVNTGCSFEAWYSDDAYTTVVSTENPYTATITADTTLYAKAHKNSLNMSVGSAEHGTASVSATTVPYGNDVTFTFTPEDETWELYGWYSDSGFTQLVSEANPYTFTATENVTLYPKVGRVKYTITLTTSKEWYHNYQNEIISYDYALLTETEISYLKTGEFDKIDQNKIYDRSSVEGTQVTTQHTTSIKCPYGYAISIYLEYNSAVVLYISRNNVNLTAWPYYTTFPTEDQEYLTVKGNPPCYCEAIIVDGILSTDVTTPVSQGKEAVFTAEIMPGYTFSGWYSDEACTTLVSTDNPAYVTTPVYTTENRSETYLTLYAKATKETYTIGVGTAEHGTASVSATTAYYGDTVIFNCTVDEDYEFKGWYSDEGLTQLVSESNPYTHSVTGSVTLYPKVGAKRYTITLKRNQYIGNGMTHHLTIASLYEDQLTDIEREYIKTGEFSKIDQAKIFDITTVDGNDMTSAITATLKAPKNLLCVLYSKISGWASEKGYYLTGFALNKDPGLGTNNVQDKVTDPSVICPWNYYSFYPKASDTYYVVVGHICDCFAIAKDGIAKATVPTHVMQYAKAPFSAELSPGYTFAGWYSDEACTQLVSTDNPAQITCPAYTGDSVSSTSLTLYAKATKKASGTGIYIKRNGAFVEANAVHKKVNGAWVQQDDPKSLFLGSPSGSESNYIYCGEL